ncbi:MazG nucleotide pyrophosphohydrolase domain-containing protein [Desulfurivibrio sp. C05AmB]|jgi:MazG family protein|uniref:MazG nucleotide pyrophosphohydrolase domain-containing protein n=1 Tax=Desulfurivibrio sp. C05AmB TaxID=3374371 RepID=UPI00376ED883
MPITNQQESAAAFAELVALVDRLRAPDGCPWDRKQTPESFKHYLLEETHELLEALARDDLHNIREELGDLLFQVIFLARLYQEQEAFGLTEVIQGITAKMVRRHPHVFGDKQVASEADLRRQWLEIKAGEKK